MLHLLFIWAMIPCLSTSVSIYHCTAHLPVRGKKKKKGDFNSENLFGRILVDQPTEQRAELCCRDPQAANLYQKEDCAEDRFSKYLEEEGKDYDDVRNRTSNVLQVPYSNS